MVTKSFFILSCLFSLLVQAGEIAINASKLPGNTGVKSPPSCLNSIQRSGDGAGPFAQQVCNDAKAGNYESAFMACLDAKPELLKGGPTFTDNCMQAAKNNFSAAYSKCLAQMNSLNINEIDPFLEGIAFNSSGAKKCDKVIACLKEEQSKGSLGPFAIGNCSEGIEELQLSESVTKNDTKVNKPSDLPAKKSTSKFSGPKMCMYNLKTGKKIVKPDFSNLPEDQKVAAYLQFVKDIEGVSVSKPCE